MPPPSDSPTDCPPGLGYLTHIDQILVHQQIEVFESKTIMNMHDFCFVQTAFTFLALIV